MPLPIYKPQTDIEKERAAHIREQASESITCFPELPVPQTKTTIESELRALRSEVKDLRALIKFVFGDHVLINGRWVKIL